MDRWEKGKGKGELAGEAEEQGGKKGLGGEASSPSRFTVIVNPSSNIFSL